MSDHVHLLHAGVMLPDIYISFIQAPLYQWLAVLMRLHPYIFATVVLFLSLAMLAERRAGREGRMLLEFVGVQAAAAVFFLWKRPFSNLGNDSLSLLWSFAILFPVFRWAFSITMRERNRRRLKRPIAHLISLFRLPCRLAWRSGFCFRECCGFPGHWRDGAPR